MLTKNIEVDVIAGSFPRALVPPHLLCPSHVAIDIANALLMLGQLTSPSGFSAASPNRYWTWLRYFSAVSHTHDLRITAPFIDLDPHQKTILSDDFGVAITTMWLFDRLGGFSEIVDGRKFLLNFPHLVRRPGTRTPKVGIGKCPDYVVRDHANRWHVLECKGTQSSTAYRNRQMASAYMQKNVIDIRGATKGDRLAAGIFLGNERDPFPSDLRVIDPEPKPLLILEERDKEMSDVVEKLAVSRALALAGFDELAGRIELPRERIAEFDPFYTREERRALELPREEVVDAAFNALRRTSATRFEVDGDEFLGQRVELRIPGDAFLRNTGCTSVRISRGINYELLENAKSIVTNHEMTLMQRSSPLLADPSIQLRSDGRTATLHEGRLSAAKLEFLE